MIVIISEKSEKEGMQMEIYERIFNRLKELNMSQIELSRKTGIATSTISDWHKKKISPQADKLVAISKALEISLVDLLCEDEKEKTELTDDIILEDKILIEKIKNSSIEVKRDILRYMELLSLKQDGKKIYAEKRNVSVIRDAEGRKIVVINDIVFKGKRIIEWKEVKAYLKKYVGDFYTIADTGDVVYIGADLPKEYSGSRYTYSIKGANAKAKANAATGLPEIIEIATGKHFRSNNEEKHQWNAKKRMVSV